MANRLYPLFKQALLTASVNLSTATVKAQLIDIDQYTYAATDQFLSAIPSGARVGAAVVLTSKTVTAGAFGAAASTFTSVPAGTGSTAQLEAIAIYVDTGDPTTSPLVALMDTATGLPLTPNGGNVVVTWNGIFAL